MTLSDNGVIMNFNLKTTLLWNEKCGFQVNCYFLQLTKKVNEVNLFQKSD